jgi:hypothetical protein
MVMLPHHVQHSIAITDCCLVLLLCFVCLPRRVLVNLGLPGAGTPAKLQQRALAVAEVVAQGRSLSDAVEVARRLR